MPQQNPPKGPTGVYSIDLTDDLIATTTTPQTITGAKQLTNTGNLLEGSVWDWGGFMYNVKAANAKGDNATDDTTAQQNAINAAIATAQRSGVLYPAGTYLVNTAGTQGLSIGSSAAVDNSILMLGVGRGSVIKAKTNTVPAAGGLLINMFGTAATFQFQDLAFDGNGANQTITSNFFKGLSADGNVAGGDAAVLRVRSCLFTGFKTTSPNFQGLCINTFGAGTQFLTDITCESSDFGPFVTQPFVSSVNRTLFANLFCHNMTVTGLETEGFGGITGTNLQVSSDALSSVTGLRLLTTNVINKVALYGGTFENIGYMVNGGAGGTNQIADSSLMGLAARNCRGSYGLFQFDSSCDIVGLAATNCAQGAPLGGINGSLETGGNGNVDKTIVTDIRIINSANNGVNVNSATLLHNGKIKGSTFAAINWQSSQATSTVRGVDGYNPKAGVTTPGFPATTVAVTNQTAVDVTAYITAGSTQPLTVQVDTDAALMVIPATQTGAVWIPSLSTFTPTYAAGGTAPAWKWKGN